MILKIFTKATIGLTMSLSTLVYANDLDKLKDQLKSKIEQESQKNKLSKSKEPQAALPPSLTCNSERMGICYAFTGADNKNEKVKKGNDFACKMMKSQLADASICPADKAIGSCRVLAGHPKEYTLFYYKGRYSKSSAQRDCSNAKSSIHAQGAGDWSEL